MVQCEIIAISNQKGGVAVILYFILKEHLGIETLS